MSVASFRDFKTCFLISQLFNHRIQSIRTYQFPSIRKSFNINKLCHKVDCSFPNTSIKNKSKDFNFSFKDLICLLFNKRNDKLRAITSLDLIEDKFALTLNLLPHVSLNLNSINLYEPKKVKDRSFMSQKSSENRFMGKVCKWLKKEFLFWEQV